MHYVKLLGQKLMAREFDRQVAELQIRAAVHNGCCATKLHDLVNFGIPQEIALIRGSYAFT